MRLLTDRTKPQAAQWLQAVPVEALEWLEDGYARFTDFHGFVTGVKPDVDTCLIKAPESSMS